LWGWASGTNGTNWHYGKQQKIGLGKEDAGFGDTTGPSRSRAGKCTDVLGSERPRGTNYLCEWSTACQTLSNGVYPPGYVFHYGYFS
jgi:hypothetical protein